MTYATTGVRELDDLICEEAELPSPVESCACASDQRPVGKRIGGVALQLCNSPTSPSLRRDFRGIGVLSPHPPHPWKSRVLLNLMCKCWGYNVSTGLRCPAFHFCGGFGGV
jgi:hypothetical protein